MDAADPTPLIAITPGERDAAAAAIRGMSVTLLMGMVVDSVVAAINEHREKTNALLTAIVSAASDAEPAIYVTGEVCPNTIYQRA